MRWLLQWLLEDLRGLLVHDPRALAEVRGGLVRARHRHAHHRELARVSSERANELKVRLRSMELSDEAEVEALVELRRELVHAEGDVRHHRARAVQTEEAMRLMREDRKRLRSGEPAEHRQAYLELLDR